MDGKLLVNEALYREVILEKLLRARESVWIATANLKELRVEHEGRFRSVLELFAALAKRKVELRILHAELPSRPFREGFDRRRSLVRGGLDLKICPRVHFKCLLVDGAWLYFGSANFTGAGLGAKHPDKRNFELGVVTEDFEVIDPIAALFQSVWSGSRCGTCQLRAVCPDPLGPRSDPARRGRARRAGGVVLGRARRLT